MSYIGYDQAKASFGVSADQLRRWAREGRVKFEKKDGGIEFEEVGVVAMVAEAVAQAEKSVQKATAQTLAPVEEALPDATHAVEEVGAVSEDPVLEEQAPATEPAEEVVTAPTAVDPTPLQPTSEALWMSFTDLVNTLGVTRGWLDQHVLSGDVRVDGKLYSVKDVKRVQDAGGVRK